jgi:hypothetical protein
MSRNRFYRYSFCKRPLGRRRIKKTISHANCAGRFEAFMGFGRGCVVARRIGRKQLEEVVRRLELFIKSFDCDRFLNRRERFLGAPREGEHQP